MALGIPIWGIEVHGQYNRFSGSYRLVPSDLSGSDLSFFDKSSICLTETTIHQSWCYNYKSCSGMYAQLMNVVLTKMKSVSIACHVYDSLMLSTEYGSICFPLGKWSNIFLKYQKFNCLPTTKSQWRSHCLHLTTIFIIMARSDGIHTFLYSVPIVRAV